MSEKKNITKEYTNGEVTIVWKPGMCIHSEKCVKGLPAVFDPNAKPWINVEGADTEALVNQVKQCPSGALSFYMNGEDKGEVSLEDEQIVEVMPNGPLMVYGNISLKHADGHQTKQNRVTAFCRCGASGNKPFCDGTHKKIGFEG